MKKIVFSILVLISLNAYCPELSNTDREAKELNKSNERELELLFTAEFNEDNLRRLLELLNVDHVNIVIEQMRLETGNFKSNLFRNHNNLTGMHYPRVRKTHATGYTIADNKRRCSVYDTWIDSVKDYILYIEYYKSLGFNTNDYYSFLKIVGYCEKDSYTNLLRKMVG